MAKTSLAISGERFLINAQPVYGEIEGSRPEVHGLLMNARFIQGIFDDAFDRSRYARWGRREFDPDVNTDELIAALPAWYAHGLRAFTVGFQGGGPCFTTDLESIDNNPFGEDGRRLDGRYAERMDRLLRAADDLGMAVIVSLFYASQALRLRDGRAVRNAVTRASGFLREGGYENVIIEIANEQNVGPFRKHPLICTEDGMVTLMDQARKESGHLPVGCSSYGRCIKAAIAAASDVVLFHGNGCTRQVLHNLIGQCRELAPGRPLVCNEDSQAIGQLTVTFAAGASWGYYNNMTKQEPPTDWRILPGEDTFFAYRMAEGLGIETPALAPRERYYLQGLEPAMSLHGMRWIRLASLYPESIDHVDFYRNGTRVSTCYDEPFSVGFECNWRQKPVYDVGEDERWLAVIHLRDGTVIEKASSVEEMRESEPVSIGAPGDSKPA
jgi:hypothetical protein